MTEPTSQPSSAPPPVSAPQPSSAPATTDPKTYRFDRLGVAFTIGEGLLLLIAAASAVGLIRDDDAGVRVLSVANMVVIGMAMFAAVVAAAVVIGVSVSGRSPRARFLTWAIGGALVFAIPTTMFALVALLQAGLAWQGTLLSLPTTVFALWTFRRMQRNRKPPWLLVLVAFAWGVLVAGYFSQIVEGILHVVITAEVLPGTASIIAHAAAAAVPEELVKGAGVVVIVLLAWRRVDGMLGGIVIGACVGLGFQFVESMSYMTSGFDTVLYQHWYRQVTGLLVSHATYTGIIGAGVGLAMQLTDWRKRVVCAGGGFAFAVAAHLIWDIFAMGRIYWESDNSLVQLFVAQPLNLIVLKGPAFAVLLFLIVIALRLETRSLYRHLQAEADSPHAAVTRAEVSVLVNASLRFRMRIQALWRGNHRNYLWIHRLHTAQLNLAFARWRSERGDPPPPGTEEALRQRIQQLKAEAA
ncbi:PrsW family intramembrane metalloprotease [Micromonospora sp. NPDC003197]